MKKRIVTSLAAVITAAVLACFGVSVSATAADGPLKIEPLKEPLAYDGELVEVTQANTLRHRYHSYDLPKDIAFYLERAKQKTEGRKSGKMRILEVLIREIDLVDSQGKVAAICKIPEQFVTEVKEYEKLFGDVVYASSEGAMTVEWLPAKIVDKVRYNNGDLGSQWWFNPKGAEGELEFLKEFKSGDVDFMFFFLHVARKTDNNQDVWPAYGGMAYGNEEIKGARVVVLNDHELARGVHEWQHHIFDTTIQETEGITVTRGHGLIDAGYAHDSLHRGGTIGNLNQGPCLAYYWDCNRFFQPRDMWERWRLRPAHNTPREPFSGKAYKWADVRSDYWFKLPQLWTEQLLKLTGLQMVQVAAAEGSLVFEVGDGADLASPRLEGDIKNDAELNNAINLFHESAAFLKTPTGKWLFVKPQVADVYVDMLRIRGKAAQPLPVYGYVLEGLKALVAIRLPDDIPTPTDEISLFRPIPISVQAEGLLSPDDYRFRDKLTLTLKSEVKGAKIHYTVNPPAASGGEPTEQSPVCDGAIKLSDSATVQARLIGGDAGSGIPTWSRKYVCQPFSIQSEGLAKGYGMSFDDSVTIKMTPAAAGGTIRYTLDGSVPGEQSPAYEKPIVLDKTTPVSARYFDAAGKARGFTWSARYEKKNLTTGKPVTISGPRNENEKAEFAVDGLADGGKYWGTIPAPQWLQVDLQKEVMLDRAHIWPYWDGGRYYQYTIEVSTDGKAWTTVVDASKNTETETERGRLHKFAPTKARYVKVNMLKNSDNPAVHLVELQVFEVGK